MGHLLYLRVHSGCFIVVSAHQHITKQNGDKKMTTKVKLTSEIYSGQVNTRKALLHQICYLITIGKLKQIKKDENELVVTNCPYSDPFPR